MTFGVKFSASEVDDAFAEMKIDEVTYFVIIIILSDTIIMIQAFHGFDQNCWACF